MDARAFRQACGRFATGVTVITAETEDGRLHGMTANAFSSLSLDPPLILVAVDKNATTHAVLHRAERFVVNILTTAQRHAAQFFAQKEKTDWTHIALGRTPSGQRCLEGNLATLDCQLYPPPLEGGDHTIFVGKVEWVELGEGDPLLFYSGQLIEPRLHHHLRAPSGPEGARRD
ncbi:MAG: flavin reductase family protein [Firmicutes bacterium]|nr:flavin reductase family protein [Alicyclobacillaceae bacterium]MCL6496039.1 flavin reductase family protein [Bacillota bacterium]